MISPFKTSTSGITAQPSTEKLIARSTSAADTAKTLTVSGTVAAAADTDAIALTGQREVEGAKTFTALVAASLNGQCQGAVALLGQGTKAEAPIIVTTNPANNDTLIVGLTGFLRTYTFKTTLTGAANEIKIGTLASDTAVNIRRAIRNGDAVIGDGTGAGTLYGTGTTAHPHFTIIAISGTVLTAQDLIACQRQLAWSFAQGTGATLSLGTMLGGADGRTLVTFAALTFDISKIGAITLDDEGLTLAKIPPLVSWVSDWITLGGKPATIYLDAESVSTPMPVCYETTTDPLKAHVWDGAVAIKDLSGNSQIISLTEIAQYVRLNIFNPNDREASVNVKIVSA